MYYCLTIIEAKYILFMGVYKQMSILEMYPNIVVMSIMNHNDSEYCYQNCLKIC